MTGDPDPTAARDPGTAFAFFNEIGIINQLSTAMLAKALPDGVHPSHFFILNHLSKRGDGRTPISIAGAMQVTKTTMTHSLKVLEERGFVSVGPNPADARGKLVYLTGAGRAFRDQAIARVTVMFDGVLSGAPEATMARLLPELARLRQHLDDARTEPPAARPQRSEQGG